MYVLDENERVILNADHILLNKERQCNQIKSHSLYSDYDYFISNKSLGAHICKKNEKTS